MRITRTHGVVVFSGLVAVGVAAGALSSVDAKSDPVVVGTAVPATTAAATYTHPTATYRQPDNSLYLDLLASEGYTTIDTATAVEAGEAVCELLDAGGTVAMATGIALGEGLTGEQAGVIIGSAVFGLCPEHADQVDAFLDTYGGGR